MDFGTWRAALQGAAGQRTWAQVFGLAKTAHEHPDFEHIWLPYALAQMRSWPKGMCAADKRQTRWLLEHPEPGVAALCRDGITLQLDLMDDAQRRLPGLPISALTLSLYETTDAQNARALAHPCLHRTRRLRVEQHTWTQEHVDALFRDEQLPSVESLHLEGHHVPLRMILRLAHLECTGRLSSFKVRGMLQGAHTPDFHLLLGALPRDLRILQLHLPPGLDHARALRDLERFQALEHLTLSWGRPMGDAQEEQVEVDPDALLSWLDVLSPRLRHLSLSHLQMPPAVMSALCDIATCLDHLGLIECVASQRALQDLVSDERLEQLKTLELSLDDPQKRPWLETCDWSGPLRDVRVSASDASWTHHIERLQRPQEHTCLTVSAYDVLLRSEDDDLMLSERTNALFSKLSKLPVWEHVRELRLKHAPLTDALARQLASGQGPPKLRTLQSNYQALTRKGWDDLVSCPDLRILNRNNRERRDWRAWQKDPGPTLHIRSQFGVTYFQHLVDHPEVSRLRELRIDHFGTIYNLVRAESLSKLERLQIRAHDIPPQQMLALARAPHFAGCDIQEVGEPSALTQVLKRQPRLDLTFAQAHHREEALLELLEYVECTHLSLSTGVHTRRAHQERVLTRMCAVSQSWPRALERLTRLELRGNAMRLKGALNLLAPLELASLKHLSIRTGRMKSPRHVHDETHEVVVPAWFRGLETLEVEIIEAGRARLLGQLMGSGVEVRFV